MRELIQIGLRVSAIFFLSWSLALVSDPLAVHKLISTGPFDPVTQTMLSGSFLGFAILLLISSNDPRDDFTGGMASMMLIVGVVSAFNMAGSHAMPANIYTVLSTLFIFGMGVYLIAGQMQEVFAIGAGKGRSRSRSARQKKAKKKAIKKKAGEKAKKTAAKKRRR